MSTDEERGKRAAEVFRKTAVLQLPGMESVEVKVEQSRATIRTVLRFLHEKLSGP
jgi:hypothetical protein